MRVLVKNLKNFGGKEDIKSLPPSWASNIPAQFPNIMVFEPWTYTTSLTNSKNRPIKAIQVKHGTSLPTWVTLTWSATNAGGSVTMAGTPDNLSQLGTTNFTLSAINDTGATDHNFTIVVIDGDTPTWNSNSLSSTSVTVFDAFSGNVSITTPTAGPLTSVVLKSGTFPGWATLSANGNAANVAGTPNNLSQLGTYTFILTANNRYGGTDHTFNITVNNGAIPVWSNETYPSGSSGTSYNSTVNVTVPSNGPLTNVTVSSGSLASWITLSYNSVSGAITLRGSPVTSNSIFKLTATNRYGSVESQQFSISVINAASFLTHFDNGLGGSFVDSSPNGYLLTPTTLTQYSKFSRFGTNCAQFNGTSSNLLGTAGDAAFKFSGNFEIDCWVYPISGTHRGIFNTYSGNVTGSGTGVALYIESDGTFAGYFGTSGVHGPAVTYNAWTHVAIERNNNTCSLYVNGISVGTPVANSTNFSDGYCKFGMDNNSEYFNGYMDEFRISNISRYAGNFIPSTKEYTSDNNTNLLLHFNGDFTDSRNNLPITNNNVLITPLPKINTACAKFDGSSYLTGSIGNGTRFTGDFTIEYWMYPTSNSIDLFSIDSGTSNTTGIYSWIGSDSKIYLGMNNVNYTGPTCTLNTWNHVAVVRNGSTVKVYINGTGSSVMTTSNVLSDGYLYIGKAVAIGNYKGLMDEIRISNIARYTANFTPSTSQFTADTTSGAITKFGTSSCKFNGTTSGLTGQAGNNAYKFSGNFTIEGWAYSNALPTSGVTRTLFDTRSSTGSTTGTGFYIQNTSLVVPGSSNISVTNTIITANTWFHFAVVRNGSIITLYINGTPVGTVSQSQNYSDGYLKIGSLCDGTLNWNGYIDEFRISNIARNITSFVPPTTAPDTNNATSVLHFDNSLNDSVSGTTKLTNSNVTFSSSPVKYGSNCAYFNGTNARLYLTNTSDNAFKFSGDFSVDFWQYQTAYTVCTIFASNTTVNDGTGIYIYQDVNNVIISSHSETIITTANPSLNTWHHIALIRSNGVLTYYIDGVSKGSAANSTNFSDGGCNIGGWGGAYYQGYIDEFRVSNNYARWTVYPIQTQEYMQDANTNLLLHFNGNFTDYSQNNLAISNYDAMCDAANYTNYLMHFDSLNNDISDNAVQLTYNGTPYAAPKFGSTCAKFNGSTSYLQGQAGNDAFKFPGNFTVECWLYPLANGWSNIFITQTNREANGISLQIGSSGQLRLERQGIDNVDSISTISLNTWNHIAVVRNGSITTVYLNGMAVISSSIYDNVNFSSGYFYVGRSNNGGSPVYYYNGYMDEFRINNTTAVYTSNFTPPASQLSAISGTSLLLHFDGDFSDSANSLTITNNNVLCAPSKFGNGMYFDGSTNYIKGVSGPWTRFSADFTVDFWFYQTSLTTVPIFDTGTGGNATRLNIVLASGQIRGDTSASGSLFAACGSYTANSWNHFAITRSGSSLKVFLNGTAIYSGTNSQAFTDGAFYIGSNYPPNSYFNGFIDELRILNDTAAWTANFTPPTSPYN